MCARRLQIWGASVQVWTTSPAERFGDVPRHQLTILQRMGVSVSVSGETVDLPPADLLIDAIIGYNLRGSPIGVAAGLIGAANCHGAPILALEVPSGVDTSTGTVHDPAIGAAATLTLALPKSGLSSEVARSRVGELYLGDISVPPQLYRGSGLGLDFGPVFAKDDVIRLW